MENFKYSEGEHTDQNSTHETCSRRLNTKTAGNHLTPQFLSSLLLSGKVKFKIRRITTLHIILYVCDTWSYSVREECRLRICENAGPTGIIGSKRVEVLVTGKRYR